MLKKIYIYAIINDLKKILSILLVTLVMLPNLIGMMVNASLRLSQEKALHNFVYYNNQQNVTSNNVALYRLGYKKDEQIKKITTTHLEIK